ncbi:triose-phosphate isomerase [Candidatus Parcubacteria bacterium]|nr:triose-phosphate isomerase [Candidatus Parcubacteria bacterium]
MKTFVIANWKMNPSTLTKAKLLFEAVDKELRNIKKAEVVICPPFVYLPDVQNVKSNIKLGAQDCFWEDKGSFTGEVSLPMLKSFGCKYAIIGHSERRQFLNETDRMVNKKIKAALIKNMRPIFCFGESKKDKGQGKTQTVLKKQLENGLKKISKSDVKKIIFAYEPLWAIGSNRPCSPDEANVIRFFVKKVIAQKYFRSVANEIKILYGGSVNNSNVKSFIKQGGFNGVLVGGASLKPKEFIKLVKNI